MHTRRGGRVGVRVRWGTRRLRRPHVDALALQNYRLERIAELFFPIATALLEGGVVGVIAVKQFQAHPSVVALITAAPMFGNLSSFLWARLAHGRAKIPLLIALQGGFVALTALTALVPEGALGLGLLVGSLVGARLILGGTITVRSLVWTLNYPRETRARMTSRLALLATFVMSMTSLGASLVLDADPTRFPLVYSGGALLASVGVIVYARVRVRDEESHLALEREGFDGETPVSPGIGGVWSVLRDDPRYARYLAWQFLLGVSNMMVEGPLIYLVSRELAAGYTASIAVTTAIPLGLTVLTIPLWAAYLDRVHIARFRARHSWFFAASQLVLFAGAAAGSIATIAASRVILGLARGGGTLAWQLGHNDFAAQHRAGLYMGVHVTLTGLRGAFAPFLGMLLYVGWAPIALPGFGIELPGFDGVGAALMAGCCALSATAGLGFIALQRRIERE